MDPLKGRNLLSLRSDALRGAIKMTTFTISAHSLRAKPAGQAGTASLKPITGADSLGKAMNPESFFDSDLHQDPGLRAKVSKNVTEGKPFRQPFLRCLSLSISLEMPLS